MFLPAIKTAPRLIFLLTVFNSLYSTVLSHWINLNLWHDELAVWDQPISSAMTNNNYSTIINPGGRQRGLPGCHELDGLTEGQIKLCLLFADHMKPVIQGAKLGLSECRWQFRHHHWNCSVLPMIPPQQPSSSSPSLSPSPSSSPLPRVLRENKNVNVNSRQNNPSYSSRRRNARMKKHQTQNDQGGPGPSPPNDNSPNLNSNQRGGTTPNSTDEWSRPGESQEYFLLPKPKKKGRKNQISYKSEDEADDYGTNGPNNNNIVLTTATSSSSSLSKNLKTGYNQHPSSAIPHPLNNDKEQKANWNSILTRGTKEVAFAQAVWSAAVTEAVARSCREGSITSCGCGKTPRPSDLKAEWRWGGCGDNLQYGYKFAQSFVDIKEQEDNPVDKKAKARSLVNLHNNEAGRRAVLKKTKIACKCHGVSGSCALVTCWHQIPTFREIGDHLKQRYMKATQVKLNKRGRLQVKKSGVPVPSVVDLVYIESSPNYCVQNETLGIYGTSGRVCNGTASSPNSCKNLCCNRGYTSVVSRSNHRCNCTFVWCCHVSCSTCFSVQKYDVCK